MVHLLNVAPHAQTFTVRIDGVPLADGFRFELAPRSALMLPLDVGLESGTLRWATAETDGDGGGSAVLLRRGAGPGRALLETDRDVTVDGEDAEVSPAEGGGVLVSWPGGAPGGRLRIRLT